MMGVYIKGMEMPTSCADCELAEHYERYGQEHYCPFTGWYADYEKCPLVPVPPHGRLIDADAYESLLRGIGNREYRRENGTICDAIKFLHPHYAPTIIEAEEAAAKDIDVPSKPYDLLYEEGGLGIR